MLKMRRRVVLAVVFVVYVVVLMVVVQKYNTVKVSGEISWATEIREESSGKSHRSIGLNIENLSLLTQKPFTKQLNQNGVTTNAKPDRNIIKTIEEAWATKNADEDKNTLPKAAFDEPLQANRGWSSRACPQPTKPTTEPKDEEFQPIAGSDSYAYSAFAISEWTTRVIFIFKKTDMVQLFTCQYKHRLPGSNIFTKAFDAVPGKYQQILDDHKKPYTAAFLNCPLPAGASLVPDLSVTIEYKNRCQNNIASNLLPVQRSPNQTLWEFTVCVAPFHKNYSKVDDLIEMVELNRILGAKHFYFYNDSCSPLVAKVLSYYQGAGLVNVLQWHLPREKTTTSSTISNSSKNNNNNDDNSKSTVPISIHYVAQNAAINDCLYRNRKRSKYVVITDIDEFIIPHKPNITTWSQFVKNRLALNPRFTNFLVRSSYYRKEWMHHIHKFPLLDKAKAYNSVTLQTVQREDNLFNHTIRSKYIVNPSLVDEGGIHYVHRHLRTATDYVPASEAIVHHYKKRWNPSEPLLRIYDDTVVRKYGEPLVQALEKTKKQLGLAPV